MSSEEYKLEAKDLDEAIFQSLGAASMCWETLMSAGVFDSTRAHEIGRQLKIWVESYMEGYANGRVEAALENYVKARGLE